MTMQERSVVVKQLPAIMNKKHERVFLKELKASMQVDRPYLVLDCSHVRVMDKAVIHLLLCSLEEAIKRNGDIKLAAIPAGAERILEQTGVHRLFEIFDTAEGAVTGFHKPNHAVTPEALVKGVLALRPESKKAGVAWSFWQAQSVGGFEEN